jgi:hypothetical protein
MSDGRLGLIDFGCVVRYEGDAIWQMFGRIHQAMLTGEDQCVRDVMKEWQQLTDEPRHAEQLRLSTEFGKRCWKPYYAPGPFDCAGREYLQRGVDLMAEMMKKRCTKSHPTGLMQFRWQVGWWMLQYRLGAVIDPTPIVTEEAQVTGWET